MKILVTICVLILPIFRAIFFLLKSGIKLYNYFVDSEKSKKKAIGIFHPYCDGGGGGERVLWVFIFALLNDIEYRNKIHIYLYSGENISENSILRNVKNKFDIDVTTSEMRKSITIVPIHTRTLLEAKWYPFLTMLGQSLGGLIVGFECCMCTWIYPFYNDGLFTPIPDVFIDTMGASFSYFAAKLCNCDVITYTHYPTISSDMLKKVRDMRPSYNNNAIIAKSASISTVKLIYYSIYACIYGFIMKHLTDQVIVNSSWTEGHIKHIVNGIFSSNEASVDTDRRVIKIFPPCNTSILTKFKLLDSQEFKCANGKRLPLFLSIGQFRPEKEHAIQICAFYKVLQIPEYRNNLDIKLYLIGSVRNGDDQKIVDRLNILIHELHHQQDENEIVIDFKSRIKLCTNVKYEYIKEITHCGSIGLHSMWNEHFGISVVEMMAAGLITIANNSGGPQKDIITRPCPYQDKIVDSDNFDYNGCLCQTVDEYASAMSHSLDIVLNHPTLHKKYQENAKNTVLSQFSDETFEKEMLKVMKNYI